MKDTEELKQELFEIIFKHPDLSVNEIIGMLEMMKLDFYRWADFEDDTPPYLR